MGRAVLSNREVQSMLLSEQIIHAFRGRKASGNWADWAHKNPQSADLLVEVEKELNGAN